MLKIGKVKLRGARIVKNTFKKENKEEVAGAEKCAAKVNIEQ